MDEDELLVRTPSGTPRKSKGISPEKRSRSAIFDDDENFPPLHDLSLWPVAGEELDHHHEVLAPDNFVMSSSLRESFAEDQREQMIRSLHESNDSQLLDVVAILGRKFVLPEPDYFVYGFKFKNAMGHLIEAQSDLNWLCEHAKDPRTVVEMVRHYDAKNNIHPEAISTPTEDGDIHVSFFRYPSKYFDI